MSDALPNHLGGHANTTHVDRGALVYLIEAYGVTSMVDLGCGPGGQVREAQGLGIQAFGIDGDWTCGPEEIHDFTKGPFLYAPKVDLVWCVEFLEHVEKRYLPNVMPFFDNAEVVVISAAPPGKAGHHHVNCQGAGYWIEQFHLAGLTPDKEGTMGLRGASTMRREFIRDRGIVFTRQYNDTWTT
jgi:hypothetical protein